MSLSGLRSGKMNPPQLCANCEVLAKNLDAIAEVCGLAGIGSRGQSYLCRVKDLHAALGKQIARAEKAESEVAELRKKLEEARR